MIITGSFKNVDNVDITVYIYKNDGDNTTYNISDDALSDENHFAFVADGVKINHNFSDLFTPIISGDATISLISNIWVGDMLYATDLGDIIVYIKKGNNLEFIGYVEPRTYSQPINQKINSIDIHCLDWLMASESFKLSKVLPYSYEELFSNASYISVLDTLEMCQLFNKQIVTPAETFTKNLFIDNNVQDILDKKIHTSLWLGDDEDDEKSISDIITEICKYLNCRIVSPNGLYFYILSNDASSNYTTVYNANTQTVVSTSLSSVLPAVDISDENVSLDDVNSQISVTCKLDTLDDVIEQPLEDGSLESPYTNGELYMTEYISEPEDGKSDSYNEGKFFFLVAYGNYFWSDPLYDASCTKASMKNWYMRYVYNKNWHFNNNFEQFKTNNNVIDGNLYAREYYPMLDLNSNYCVASNDQADYYKGYINNYAGGWAAGLHTLPYQTMELHPYIISLGEGDLKKHPDSTPEKQPTYKNYMIIPCPETWLSYNVSGYVTEQDAYDWINAQLEKYDPNSPNYGGKPLVQYKSSVTMNLTPAEETTKNYIVFEGKLKLLPSVRATGTAKQYTDKDGTYDYIGLSAEMSREQLLRAAQAHASSGPGGTREAFLPKATGTSKDTKRYYWQRYYTKKFPNNTDIFSAHHYLDTGYKYEDGNPYWMGGGIGFEYIDTDTGCPRTRLGMMWMPDVDSYNKQWLPYEKTTRTGFIIEYPYPYCPILLCKMRVGDKYLSEVVTATDTRQNFVWTSDPSSTFTLGIAPKRQDDYIIGGEAKDIANNITTDMNLQEAVGTAVPITKNDILHGDVEFTIIGPFNAIYDSANGIYKCFPWFREPQTLGPNDVSLLNHLRGIQIEEFKCTIQSDHAKNAAMNADNDLCYLSVNTGLKTAELKDTSFEITTAISETEAAKLGITTGVSYNNPLNADNSLFIVDSPYTQEEKYVNTLFNLYSTPKKLIDYEANYTKELTEMYRCIYECNLMQHLNTEDFNTIVTGNEISLYYNRIKIQLREI